MDCGGLQPVVFSVNLFDFHPETWAMPLLTLAVWANRVEQRWLWLISRFDMQGLPRRPDSDCDRPGPGAGLWATESLGNARIGQLQNLEARSPWPVT